MRLIFRVLAAGALVLGLSAPSGAATFPLTISGNEASATIALPGGLGADLTLTFEDVVGLNPSALTVSASVLSPTDTGVLSRLGGLLPPAGLPMLLKINPPASSALTFSGIVTISLHTHNLNLVPNLTFSLFSSSAGANFRDITVTEGIGSYRVGGSTGGFSEFIIVLDLRPIDGVISGKFDAIQLMLNDYGDLMAPGIASSLQTRLDQARADVAAGQLTAAANDMTAFSAFVKTSSGAGIPDVWRANDSSRPNVAGSLRAAADSLRFSINRKASRP